MASLFSSARIGSKFILLTNMVTIPLGGILSLYLLGECRITVTLQVNVVTWEDENEAKDVAVILIFTSKHIGEYRQHPTQQQRQTLMQMIMI